MDEHSQSKDIPNDWNVNQDLEKLARRYADDFEGEPIDELHDLEEDGGVSLEELGMAYARVMGLPASDANSIPSTNGDSASPQVSSPIELEFSSHDAVQQNREESGTDLMSPDGDEERWPVTPIAIVEAVLLVGRPDGAAITSGEIAGLMRGVSESEVDALVDEINADYLAHARGWRIVASGGGYRMQLAEDLEGLRQSLFGPTRPIKLSQSAIDCLALVSYQPGISRDMLDQQLGKSCGAILNQLVRRQLLQVKREKKEGELETRYSTTQRLLDLAGLESLDDLPTAEEWVDRV